MHYKISYDNAKEIIIYIIDINLEKNINDKNSTSDNSILKKNKL